MCEENRKQRNEKPKKEDFKRNIFKESGVLVLDQNFGFRSCFLCCSFDGFPHSRGGDMSENDGEGDNPLFNLFRLGLGRMEFGFFLSFFFLISLLFFSFFPPPFLSRRVFLGITEKKEVQFC